MKSVLCSLSLLVSAATSMGGEIPVTAANLEGHPVYVEALAFSPCGKFLAAADRSEPVVWVWSVQEKRVIKKLFGPRKAVGPAPVQNLFGPPPVYSAITSLAFSPDGTMVAASSWDFCAVWDWKRSTKKLEHLPAPENIYSIAFVPDGKSILIGIEASINEFRFSDQKLIRRQTYREDEDVGALAFSSKANDLCFWKGEFNGPGLVVDFKTRQKKLELRDGHRLAAHVAVFFDNDRFIATGGWDGRVIFWNAVDGLKLKLFRIDESKITSLGHSKEAGLLVAASEYGALWTYDINNCTF